MGDSVPFLINGYIFDPEIGAQVDDLHFGKNLIIYKRSAKALRRRRKDNIHLFCKFFHIIIHTDVIHNLKHILIDFTIFLIDITSGAIPFDFHFFVTRQNPDELSAGISGRPDDSCFNHFASFPFLILYQ